MIMSVVNVFTSMRQPLLCLGHWLGWKAQNSENSLGFERKRPHLEQFVGIRRKPNRIILLQVGEFMLYPQKVINLYVSRMSRVMTGVRRMSEIIES